MKKTRLQIFFMSCLVLIFITGCNGKHASSGVGGETGPETSQTPDSVDTAPVNVLGATSSTLYDNGTLLDEVCTAAPNAVVVTIESATVSIANFPVPDLTRALWKVNGKTPKNVYRYSKSWDERELQTAGYAVTVRHYIYLQLSERLINGLSYSIVTPYGNKKFTFYDTDIHCESIKVNQVGYNANATLRYANLGVYMGDGGSVTFLGPVNYDVFDENTKSIVYSGKATYFGNDTDIYARDSNGNIALDNDGYVIYNITASGEHVYRLDLSSVPSGGPYYIRARGLGRSYSFGIGDEYSKKLAYVHTRGMYHQRCGIALEKKYTDYFRGICSNHTKIAYTKKTWAANAWITAADITAVNETDVTAQHAMQGGYHDAGDFDIRPYHVIIPVLMLGYFEAFKDHFTDGQYNIPESGNGIPDFLDEALWGVLGWENLQVSSTNELEDGGVMAGIETKGHPGYGIDGAACENASNVYGTWNVSPDMNLYATYYGTSSYVVPDVTLNAAGFFAEASRLVKPYDAARAAVLLERAKRAWNFTKVNNVTKPVSFRMYAALQLYLATATGDATADMANEYHIIFMDLAKQIFVTGAGWPDQYYPDNTSANIHTTHFSSYLLTSFATDTTLAAKLKQSIFSAIALGGYMGNKLTYPYFQGVTKFCAWGAATAQGRYADMYCFAYLLTDDPVKKQEYYNAVSQYADYSVGLNPLGKSFVTGLGSNQVNSPCHLDSWYTKYGKGEHEGAPIGNVPGIVVYGPSTTRSMVTYQAAVSNKLYPSWNNLPVQRRWADGWSLIGNDEFTTWETIVWNACMHGFLYKAN